jgi:hypothetical protein
MTRNVSFAGVLSAFPALSIAVTRRVWLPKPSRFVVKGERQERGFLASSLQRNREPGSVETKRKVGVRSLVRFGGRFLSFVFGGAVSGGGLVAQGVSVGTAALLRGEGVVIAKSVALSLVSSVASRSVGQPGVIPLVSD